jgi:hypothetical protein
VTGRALVFSDPEIVKLATKEFVAVTGDDWYRRRQDDAEGEFFRKIADQSSRKNSVTKQGIYVLTAEGKLLSYRNSQDAEIMREVIELGLHEWKKLPEEQRKPGAVKIPDLETRDPRFNRKPPSGGLVVNVYARILDQDVKSGYVRGTCKTPGGENASRDHLWLTAQEWKSLIPAAPKKGDRSAVPAGIAERIARYHLVDNTRGEPPLWETEHVRSRLMTLTVEEATPTNLLLRLDGTVTLSTHPEAKKAERGYEAHLLGYIGIDRAKKVISRFDVVAIGEHWGGGAHTAGARPGRTPLGIAFALAQGDSAANLVPPQGARSWTEYLGR